MDRQCWNHSTSAREMALCALSIGKDISIMNERAITMIIFVIAVLTLVLALALLCLRRLEIPGSPPCRVYMNFGDYDDDCCEVDDDETRPLLMCV